LGYFAKAPIPKGTKASPTAPTVAGGVSREHSLIAAFPNFRDSQDCIDVGAYNPSGYICQA
jgi:hypothetical protein